MLQDLIEIDDIASFSERSIHVDYDDVIYGMHLKDKEEVALVNSIIQHIDKSAVELVNKNKIAYIPYIGSIRYRPTRKYYYDHYDKVKEIYKQYKDKNERNLKIKEWLRPIYFDTKIQDDAAYEKIIIRENRVLWDTSNKNYRILFMYFRKHLKIVEHKD